MSEIKVSVTYTKQVWGQVELTIKLPDDLHVDDALDGVRTGRINLWNLNIVHEAWIADDSDLVDVDYENLELLDDC